MGPNIILDKSVLQRLTLSELLMVEKYFFLIIPPILIKEVLGNLAKPTKETTTPENRVASLAERIGGINSAINMGYKDLLLSSFFGKEVPLRRRCIPIDSKGFQSKSGFAGIKIEMSSEDIAISRWQQKKFSEREKHWANFWQEIHISINCKKYKTSIGGVGIDIPKPKNEQDLVKIVDDLLSNPKAQGKLLSLLFMESKLPLNAQSAIIDRWFNLGRPFIKDFSKYAAYCLRVNLLLAIGSTNESLFPLDKNDRKDLEYCYYLPFCEVFSSDDRKQTRLVSLIIENDQQVLKGNLLVDDLKKLATEWEKLSEEEKIKHIQQYGYYPPQNENSVVYQLWQRFTPERPKIQGNIAATTNPEAQEVLNELFNPIINQVIEGHYSENLDSEDETRFVVRRRLVRKDVIKRLYPHLKENN